MNVREFQFKRFKLLHGGPSFPVGTDAVILGAYAGKNLSPNHILDIGTGSGIIALMTAQRFDESYVEAVENDTEVASLTEKNFINSPFQKRLAIHNCNIKTFESKYKYDLVVSNPPYFTNSLKPDSNSRRRSKHQASMNPDDIFKFCSDYLNDNGLLSIIFPSKEKEELIKRAGAQDLYIKDILSIKSNPSSPPVRVILTFSKIKPQGVRQETLIIEKGKRHSYHDDYINLCKDFYLKFPD